MKRNGSFLIFRSSTIAKPFKHRYSFGIFITIVYIYTKTHAIEDFICWLHFLDHFFCLAPLLNSCHPCTFFVNIIAFTLFIFDITFLSPFIYSRYTNIFITKIIFLILDCNIFFCIYSKITWIALKAVLTTTLFSVIPRYSTWSHCYSS